VAEARREEREVINRYLRVFDRSANKFIGYLVDITPHGAMLQSREPVEPEKRMTLRVELPEELDASRELVVEAESVWDKKEENALFHHTGFEFRDVSSAEQEKIRRLMEMYRLEGLSH
jgi:c-di-GMP-binding flagellar brake protein YcgR